MLGSPTTNFWRPPTSTGRSTRLTTSQSFRDVTESVPVVDFSFCGIESLTGMLGLKAKNGQRSCGMSEFSQREFKRKRRANDAVSVNNSGLEIERGPMNSEQKRKEEENKLSDEEFMRGRGHSPTSFSDEILDEEKWALEFNEMLARDVAILTDMSVDGNAGKEQSERRVEGVIVRQESQPIEKYVGHALKLCSNSIGNLEGAEGIFSTIMENGKDLTWLDLSYNCLLSVRHVVEHLRFLSNTLEVLYIHANMFSDPDELLLLSHFTHLRTLSLHGNPVDEIKNYRYYVIALLPNLRVLDYGVITRREREAATMFKTMFVDPLMEKQLQRSLRQKKWTGLET